MSESNHAIQASALALCVAANISVIIWGKPGQGKTATIQEIARSNNLHLEEIIASTKEPSDFSGFPFISTSQEPSSSSESGFIQKQVMRLAPPLWASNIVREHKENKRFSIAFFDELSTAVPATQAALLTTILDRRAGETQMPKETRMMAAANPPEMANGWELSAPMANRFTHLPWSLDAATVAEGFQLGWKTPDIPLLPKDRAEHIRQGRILVGSFLRSRPQFVDYDFSHMSGNNRRTSDFSAASNAWPSPRSWDVAAKLFALARSARMRSDRSPVSPHVIQLLLEGTVGLGAATEFLAYVGSLDLPDPRELLENPSSFKPPKRGDQLSAILASLQHEAVLYAKHTSYPSIWSTWGDLIAMTVASGQGDVALPFVREWLSLRPEGTAPSQRHTEAFGGLLRQFSDLG